MKKRDMRENRETSGQENSPCGGTTGSGKPGTKKFSIPGVLSCGIAASLLSLALVLASCGGEGGSGTAPRSGDSSSSVTGPASSGLETNSSSGGVTPGSSSSGTAIVSVSSGASSSGGTVISSSAASSSGGDACDEEGARESRYFPSSKQWVDYVCASGTWVVYVTSSSSAASSSSYYDMDSLFVSIENLSYGEFTDPRDGHVYKTIKASLYEDYEYFAENLDYGVQVPGSSDQSDDGTAEKYCYDDDPWYCDNHFGGLYQWSEAMGFPSACNDVKAGSTSACPDSIVLSAAYNEPELFVQHQGICPEGWHVMSEDEWSIVIGGGDHTVKSQVLWDVHNNSRGLSVLPAGQRDTTGGYSYLETYSCFWLPHEHSTDVDRAYEVEVSPTDVSNGGPWVHKTEGHSVRCVRNHEAFKS